jgi:uncharacterized membrane protein SpoIIM required for sporulation
MRRDRFIAERQGTWNLLDAALAQSKSRPWTLGVKGARDTGALYRAAAADLAIARRLYPGDPLTARLEDLVLRGRQAVYSAGVEKMSVWRFMSTTFWQRIAERPVFPLIAFVLVFGSAGLAMLWGATDPGAASGLVPGDFINGAAPPKGSQGLSTADSAAFSSMLFTNNIKVTFLAFGAGFLFCIGGAFLLIYNGVILGAVFGLAAAAGNLGIVAQLVAAHGILEISCIVVSGGAGMRMGWALVAPGPLTRLQSLAKEARPAFEVILGCMPCLVIAGLVEGYISPAGWGPMGVCLVGFGLGGIFWGLVFTRGRSAAKTAHAVG